MSTSQDQNFTEDQYSWEPLNLRRNEFRILELLAVTEEDGERILHALVHNVPINNHPQYDALSYSWGQRKTDHKIVLNNKLHAVTENLQLALLEFMAHRIQHLWVDALCINQHDPDEKAGQVQRMATIFQEAACVLVWLGPATSTMKQTFQVLRNINRAQSLDQVIPSDIRGYHLPSDGGYSWYHFKVDLSDLLRRDYWRRLWIVQELAVASKLKIFCGSEMLEGSIFQNLFSWAFYSGLKNISDTTDPYGVSMFNISRFYHMVGLWDIRRRVRNREPMDLLNLLSELRRSNTTELLDRVYAVMGLAYDGRAFIPEPDYNLKDDDLCCLMTRRFILSTGNLDIIMLGQGYTGSDKASWVFPFLAMDRYEPSPELLSSFAVGRAQQLRCGILGNSWNTTKSRDVGDNAVRLDQSILHVRGLRLGRICSQSFSATSDRTINDLDIQLMDMFESFSRLLMIYSPFYLDESRLWVIARKFLKDSEDRVHRSRFPNFEYLFRIDLSASSAHSAERASGASFFQQAHIFHHLLEAADVKAAAGSASVPPEEDEDTIALAIARLGRSSTCFSIDLEYLAVLDNVVALPYPLPDLEVWLIPGCSLPVVLYETNEDANQPTYRLWTHAFVDSIDLRGQRCRVTEGEAWRVAEDEDLQWISIT